jgi:hypothetical protein
VKDRVAPPRPGGGSLGGAIMAAADSRRRCSGAVGRGCFSPPPPSSAMAVFTSLLLLLSSSDGAAGESGFRQNPRTAHKIQTKSKISSGVANGCGSDKCPRNEIPPILCALLVPPLQTRTKRETSLPPRCLGSRPRGNPAPPVPASLAAGFAGRTPRPPPEARGGSSGPFLAPRVRARDTARRLAHGSQAVLPPRPAPFESRKDGPARSSLSAGGDQSERSAAPASVAAAAAAAAARRREAKGSRNDRRPSATLGRDPGYPGARKSRPLRSALGRVHSLVNPSPVPLIT